MRYITPEKVINNRLKNAETYEFDGAFMIFRDLGASELICDAVEAKPFDKKLFYGIEPADTFYLEMNGKKIIIITRLIFGGPQTAILLEELAYYKAGIVIGLGACGSLSEKLNRGDIVYSADAHVTDGTSIHYTKKKNIKVNAFMEEKLLSFIKESGSKVYPSSSGTIDALYMETEELVKSFKKKKITTINMESTPFYAVSEALDIKTIWLGIVSDSLVNKNWSGWDNVNEMTKRSGELLKNFAEYIFKNLKN